ncbi:hypothetical protein FB451DRAFT_1164516 [Mycena latifolia]|nr:hypothetical protein FB451DRAFT_1164516 [Mycena latifolia]
MLRNKITARQEDLYSQMAREAGQDNIKETKKPSKEEADEIKAKWIQSFPQGWSKEDCEEEMRRSLRVNAIGLNELMPFSKEIRRDRMSLGKMLRLPKGSSARRRKFCQVAPFFGLSAFVAVLVAAVRSLREIHLVMGAVRSLHFSDLVQFGSLTGQKRWGLEAESGEIVFPEWDYCVEWSWILADFCCRLRTRRISQLAGEGPVAAREILGLGRDLVAPREILGHWCCPVAPRDTLGAGCRPVAPREILAPGAVCRLWRLFTVKLLDREPVGYPCRFNCCNGTGELTGMHDIAVSDESQRKVGILCRTRGWIFTETGMIQLEDLKHTKRGPGLAEDGVGNVKSMQGCE